MANEIIFANLNDAKNYRIFPLVEDVAITCNTSYFSASDLLGGVADLIVKGGNVLSAMSGTKGTASLQNILDARVYQGTEPVKFTVKLGLYPGVCGDKDEGVFQNYLWLLNYTIPHVQNGTYYVPGLSINNIKDVTSTKNNANNNKRTADISGGKTEKSNKGAGGTEVKTTKNKLLSIEIPGIVYLDVGMIDSMATIFSKEVTINGDPLWAHAEINVSGVRSAIHSDFSEARSSYVTDSGNVIKSSIVGSQNQ